MPNCGTDCLRVVVRGSAGSNNWSQVGTNITIPNPADPTKYYRDQYWQYPTPVFRGDNVAQISANWAATCSVLANGSAACWGELHLC